MTALALLVVLFNVTDARYRFRLQVAPFPLHTPTFIALVVIGLLTLTVDIWFTQRWLIPNFLNSRAVWQGALALLFLLVAMTWILFAFIWPPTFGRANAERYYRQLLRTITAATEADLAVVLNELGRSASAIVRHSRGVQQEPKERPDASEFALLTLMLIGSRKVCKHVVAATPATATAFFEAMVEQDRFDVPISQFSRNIAAEAILNKDSLLYHEGNEFSDGLLGMFQPFTRSVFGNYRLIENLGRFGGSPLDIRFDVFRSFDAQQLEAYCRALLITVEDYLDKTQMRQHASALHSALEDLEHIHLGLGAFNGRDEDYFKSDESQRLRAIVNFVNDVIQLLDEKKPTARHSMARLRRRQGHHGTDLYQMTADLMLQMLLQASRVTEPPDTSWWVQYNVVWSKFFKHGDSPARKVVLRLLRRMIYDQLKSFGAGGFQSAHLLAISLNAMGLKLRSRTSDFDRSQFALHKVVLDWTRKNFLSLRAKWPALAEASLAGFITYEEGRLAKGYNPTFGREAKKDYLSLDPARADTQF